MKYTYFILLHVCENYHLHRIVTHQVIYIKKKSVSDENFDGNVTIPRNIDRWMGAGFKSLI